MIRTDSESGFSLVELLVATGLLLVVSSIVTTALMQMTQSQTTIWNRTEMHSGIRGATELLQQEVGQAGRTALSATVSLNAPVAAAVSCDPGTPLTNAVTVAVVSKDASGNVVTSVNGINPLSGIFAGGGASGAYELLFTLDGDSQEAVKIASVDQAGSTVTACFTKDHLAGTVLSPLGAFATGIISPTGIVNGSSATVLKLYGDVIGDGNMVYIEYTCDTVNHNLYRNVMPYNQVGKPAVTNSQILLSNIIDNPGGTPCFTYQTTSLIVQGTPFTFVLDVAVTLTVQTQQIDPLTKQYQTETKALLNVSPRNIFAAWEMASLGYTDHIQSTPTTVTALLP
ncbi:MAG: type II secretion system protein [Acidobacteria bacterium]|nr:type II secretion system protein [Acidobacteriota bacterium]